MPHVNPKTDLGHYLLVVADRAEDVFGKLTQGGQPRHPLYLRADTAILKWRQR